MRAALVACVLAALLAACGGGGSSDPDPAEEAGPPNIVFVVLDDLDATLTPFWEAMPKTAALLRDRGTTFTNMFATDPVCCPARATLLTGMYPHNTRVYNAAGGLETFRTRASKWSIGVRLQEAGYRTAFVGKYLNGYELDPSYVPPGWDEWFGLAKPQFLTGYDYGANHNGAMESFGDRPEDYQTDVLGRVATTFVGAQTRRDQPFLLTVFPSAPHAPIGPARRDRDNRFADDELPARENHGEDLADKPTWLREGYEPVTEQGREEALSQYRKGLGSLMAVDRMIDSIADELRAAGELDDTVFVFSSDNGFSFGSHGIVGKVVPYDEAARVPLVIAGPGVRHGETGALAGAIDVAPTLYDLAGAPARDDVDGRSLAPLLRGEDPPWRDDLLIEYEAPPKLELHTFEEVRRAVAAGTFDTVAVPDYRAVRTPRWLYVEWYAGDEHEHELYDVVEDPFQLTNLLADPAGAEERREVVDELQARLEELAACAGAGCR